MAVNGWVTRETLGWDIDTDTTKMAPKPDDDTVAQDRTPFTIGEQFQKQEEHRYHPAMESIRRMHRFVIRNDPVSHRQSGGDRLTADALRAAHLGGSPAITRKTPKQGPASSIGGCQVSLISGNGDEGLIHEEWKGDNDSEHEEWHVDHTQFRDFIICWAKGVPGEQPTAVFTQDVQIDQHYLHDIDTDTGKLIEAVSQPNSMPYIDVRLNPQQLKELFNHMNDNSWAQIHGNGKQKARSSFAPEARQAPVYFSAPVVQKTSPTGRRVGVVCHFRPATKDDLRGVSKIYNWEVKNGLQATDTESVSEGDFSRILSSCKDMKVPFIVAVEKTVEDSEQRKLDARSLPATAFRDYPQLLDMATNKIIGFAFVYFHDRGLSGKPVSSIGNSTGRLVLCVDPDFRRKGVGMALVDKVLACCCTRWFAGDYYTFINPENERLYSSSTLNSCRLMRLFVDVLYKSKDDTDLGSRTQENRHWYEKFLTKTFPFKEFNQIDHYHCSGLGKDSFWLDKVTYQVVCRRPEEAYDI